MNYILADPSVKAIRWDGKLATLQAMREMVKRVGNVSRDHSRADAAIAEPFGAQPAFTIPQGEWLLLWPDGKLSAEKPSEFPAKYLPA